MTSPDGLSMNNLPSEAPIKSSLVWCGVHLCVGGNIQLPLGSGGQGWECHPSTIPAAFISQTGTSPGPGRAGLAGLQVAPSACTQEQHPGPTATSEQVTGKFSSFFSTFCSCFFPTTIWYFMKFDHLQQLCENVSLLISYGLLIVRIRSKAQYSSFIIWVVWPGFRVK